MVQWEAVSRIPTVPILNHPESEDTSLRVLGTSNWVMVSHSELQKSTSHNFPQSTTIAFYTEAKLHMDCDTSAPSHISLVNQEAS